MPAEILLNNPPTSHPPHNSPLFCYFKPLLYTIETQFPKRQPFNDDFKKKSMQSGLFFQNMS
ncbi:hypothetical protein Lmac_1746 [Legionella maceachernii]|uniref:Uncharacterized protein n=1 Tax=Legionella maceachernii TaxID=466 RepID=A0A0W0W0D3_9GAMM|nr:hypothetical protein Lmac_1746 [Legionella maceachernii]SJZ49766.1 hypothetical protein SAMN02745128_00254 [Legionella maceachernii]SUP03779.1 Uncharacterised protein [Legionella maceachernii]